MPEMNGAEACEKIIEIYKNFRVRNKEDTEEQALARSQIFVPEVICCTAYDPTTFGENLLKKGMKHVLSKPPNITELNEIQSKVK